MSVILIYEWDMNFIDRTSLGDTLAERVQQYHGKDAVVVCMQESSLLTCLTIARHIRAYVYPMIYEPVHSPDHVHLLVGAYDQDGDFVALPDGPADDEEKKLPEDIRKSLKKQKTAAMKSIRFALAGYGMTIDKRQLNGRDVILAADILTNEVPVIMARHLMKDITPRSLTAVAGNATPDVAQLLRVSAASADILDILTGITFDEEHYFEHADTYTIDEKRTLAQNITTYWQ